MSIFNSIFRSRDKPQNATSGSAYSFFVGYSSSGKRVDERTSMQMTGNLGIQLGKERSK